MKLKNGYSKKMKPRIINNHIVLQTTAPAKVLALFPGSKARTIGDSVYAAVPHTVESARIFTNMGIPVPSPICTQYSWRGRFEPRWYQEETAEFFTMNPRCHCHNAPRTGKTLSSLWAADFLQQCKIVQRVLVVAPLSTLVDVWEQNIFESFPFKSFAVLHGTREKRLKLLEKKHDFYIINHHGVALIEKELAKRPDINLVIVDEVATFRSAKNKRTKKSKGGVLWTPLNEVLNKQGIYRMAWGLTGTPIPNGPTDAYGQSKLITPENIKGYFTQFRADTMIQVQQHKWVPKRGWEKTVNKAFTPVIRFERSVCTDMEPVSIFRKADLSPSQNKAYAQLLKGAVAQVENTVITAVNAAIMLSKLVQVACGVAIAADGSLAKFDFGPRMAVLEELIQENNEKVLVFVPFTGVLNSVADKLRKNWSVEVVDGSISAAKRVAIFRAFRSEPDPHILVCHPQVMAHGLDLTTASLAIWYAPYLNAEYYQQANARIDGSRQTAKMDIAHIYATSEEYKMYKTLQTKGKMQDIVLELSKGGKK